MDIVALAQSAVLAADVRIPGKQPALVRLEETDVIRAVARGVDHLESVVLRIYPLADRLSLGRFGPAPEEPPVGLEGLQPGIRQDGQGSGVGRDAAAEHLLHLCVRADVILVAVCVDDVVGMPALEC